MVGHQSGFKICDFITDVVDFILPRHVQPEEKEANNLNQHAYGEAGCKSLEEANPSRDRRVDRTKQWVSKNSKRNCREQYAYCQIQKPIPSNRSDFRNHPATITHERVSNSGEMARVLTSRHFL